MSFLTREKCCVEGCNVLQRNKGKLNDRIIYGKKCVFCHRKLPLDNRKVSDILIKKYNIK